MPGLSTQKLSCRTHNGLGTSATVTCLLHSLLLLPPQDPVDFVRQGVMLSLALVLVAQPEARVADDLRKRLQKSVEDKHEEVMCRWARALRQAMPIAAPVAAG